MDEQILKRVELFSGLSINELQAVAISGSYAYVASHGNDSLRIIDISGVAKLIHPKR